MGVMKNSRGVAVRMAIALFMILVLCTVAAHRIETLLLTEVRTIEVSPAEKLEDGTTVVKVSPAGVFTDSNGEPYVMLIQRREGTWGTEEYVKETSVEVYSEDYDFVQLKNTDLEGQRLAIYPSRSLSNGETVRCVGE